MAHSGRPRGPHSASPSRSRRDQLGASPGRQLPCGAEDDEDWETDPDYVHDASRPWREREISTTSIISDLSRSIRDISLGKSSPHSAKDGADRQNHPLVYRDPGGKHAKAVEGHRPPLCPHVHSSPSLGIERSSLFNRNAAEKLDTFFSEKLKAWASDTARLSDTEAAQEEPTSSNTPWRTAKKGPADHEQAAGRHNHRWAAHGRGNVGAQQANSSRDYYDPGRDPHLRHPRHRAEGKGEASEGLLRRQEGSGPSTNVGSSARILPQCRISHVRHCRACQAFNQDGPAGKHRVWAPLQEEEGAGGSVPPRKDRTQPPGQQQVPDRISKVQRWLEKTPLGPQPAPLWQQQKHRIPNLASPEAQRPLPAYGSPAQREGGPWSQALGAAGDHQSRGVPAEARLLRRSETMVESVRVRLRGFHRVLLFVDASAGPLPACPAQWLLPSPRRSPLLAAPARHPATSPPFPTQPAARIVSCDDASTSPATCSCLFCERQRPRAQLVAGQDEPDPSAEAVAARLQAENRVPRIVEAFERRSLREAKIAERERARARRAAPQRDSERKRQAPASRCKPRRGPPGSGPGEARAPHPKKQEEQPRHRPGARKEGEAARRQPGLLDRLRGRC
ncbi:uncharacterized protein LOC112541799 [Python bivittatus]|uniref:Uncharacterized protein LOC112541799 n=1 Tax=Python bivittatus TaxID=176946 RepID=A0A9F5IYP3_PYTBI|nr:uncharacterized protein LOC112541799 [Python bivittatus]